MRHAASVLLSLLVVGCATTRGPEGGSAAPDTPERPAAMGESKQVAELQRQAAMAAAEIRLLRQSLAALQVEVERLATAVDRTAPPPPIGAPSARFETSDLEPVRTEPSPSLPRPELRASPPAAPVVPAPPRQPAAEAGSPVPPDGQSIYDQGYTLYHQGRYVDSESSFQRFLQAYGSTELADNAQFWIGESRFARQDYRGALAAFQEVVERFPAGNKLGDALLKTGDCLARLGDGAAAAQRYRQVTERFPGSAAAAIAEERLEGSPD